MELAKLLRQFIVSPHLADYIPVPETRSEVSCDNFAQTASSSMRTLIGLFLACGSGTHQVMRPMPAVSGLCMRRTAPEALAVGRFLEALDVGLDVWKRRVEAEQEPVLVRLPRVKEARNESLSSPSEFEIVSGAKTSTAFIHSPPQAGLSIGSAGCAGACVCPDGKAFRSLRHRQQRLLDRLGIHRNRSRWWPTFGLCENLELAFFLGVCCFKDAILLARSGVNELSAAIFSCTARHSILFQAFARWWRGCLRGTRLRWHISNQDWGPDPRQHWCFMPTKPSRLLACPLSRIIHKISSLQFSRCPVDSFSESTLSGVLSP